MKTLHPDNVELDNYERLMATEIVPTGDPIEVEVRQSQIETPGEGDNFNVDFNEGEGFPRQYRKQIAAQLSEPLKGLILQSDEQLNVTEASLRVKVVDNENDCYHLPGDGALVFADRLEIDGGGQPRSRPQPIQEVGLFRQLGLQTGYVLTPPPFGLIKALKEGDEEAFSYWIEAIKNPAARWHKESYKPEYRFELSNYQSEADKEKVWKI